MIFLTRDVAALGEEIGYLAIRFCICDVPLFLCRGNKELRSEGYAL